MQNQLLKAVNFASSKSSPAPQDKLGFPYIMSDSDKPEGQQRAKIPHRDWDTDRFPTSAMPIFRGIAILAVVILGICAVVYSTSDHPGDEEAEQRRQRVAEQFLAEEQQEEPPLEDNGNRLTFFISLSPGRVLFDVS